MPAGLIVGSTLLTRPVWLPWLRFGCHRLTCRPGGRQKTCRRLGERAVLAVRSTL